MAEVKIPFTPAEREAAHAAWGFNCGPAAVCAITGMKPEALRPHLSNFEAKGYTNPTLMLTILKTLGVSFVRREDNGWPVWGLVRIQWHGPWMKPGVPMRARYRLTHWVASRRIAREIAPHGVFDVNVGYWCSFESWRDVVVPTIIDEIPGADGSFSVTHALEVLP